MSGPDDERINRILEAICSYLARHPDAADSEEGIAAWWLPGMGVETSAAEVGVALERLCRSGKLERQHQPDGRVIYRAHARPFSGEHKRHRS